MQILQERQNLNLFRKLLLQKRQLLSLVQYIGNIPGNNKNIFPSLEIANYFLCTFTEYLLNKNIFLVEKHERKSILGTIYYFLIDYPAKKLKRLCLELEEKYSLGKYWDIDIFYGKEKIYRNSLGYPPKKCFICEKPAKKCIFEKRHSIKELLAKLLDDYNNSVVYLGISEEFED